MTFPSTDHEVFFSRRVCRCGSAMDPVRLRAGIRSWHCSRCGRASRR